jgi:hypothetical protein
MRKMPKMVLALGIGAASMLAASPANAWGIRHYYGAGGVEVGQQWVCENNSIIWQWYNGGEIISSSYEDMGYGAQGIYC